MSTAEVQSVLEKHVRGDPGIAIESEGITLSNPASSYPNALPLHKTAHWI